jgi:hypothetical protein
MMICLFLRLSTVTIFPRAADHAKKPPSKEPEPATHSSKGSVYLQSKPKSWRRTSSSTILSWKRPTRAYLHDFYSFDLLIMWQNQLINYGYYYLIKYIFYFSCKNVILPTTTTFKLRLTIKRREEKVEGTFITLNTHEKRNT